MVKLPVKMIRLNNFMTVCKIDISKFLFIGILD